MKDTTETPGSSHNSECSSECSLLFWVSRASVSGNASTLLDGNYGTLESCAAIRCRARLKRCRVTARPKKVAWGGLRRHNARREIGLGRNERPNWRISR
jgi:hypothetical protein